MNKFELVRNIAMKTGMTKTDAEKAYEAVFEAIEEALVAGEKVTVSGFGTFEVKQRKARTGHDPRSKEPISIPSLKAATFKPGKNLKENVR